MPVAHVLATRQFAKKRSHVVYACAEPGGPCGWPFGIAPYYIFVSWQFSIAHSQSGHVPWSVILNIIFLYFLHVVICLWIIHSFGTMDDQQSFGIVKMEPLWGRDLLFPGEIPQQRQHGQCQPHQPKNRTSESSWYRSEIFG